MIIVIDDFGTACLNEPDDFRSFKVVVSRHVLSLDKAVAAFGELDGGQNAWVSQDWLIEKGRPDDSAWRNSLGQMIAYAESRGWLNPETRAIRAHLEWAPGPEQASA
jgi:hypothetical protein